MVFATPPMDTESTLNIWLIHHPPVLKAREPTLESRSCPLRRMIDKMFAGVRSVVDEVGIEWKPGWELGIGMDQKDGGSSFRSSFFIVVR